MTSGHAIQLGLEGRHQHARQPAAEQAAERQGAEGEQGRSRQQDVADLRAGEAEHAQRRELAPALATARCARRCRRRRRRACRRSATKKATKISSVSPWSRGTCCTAAVAIVTAGHRRNALEPRTAPASLRRRPCRLTRSRIGRSRISRFSASMLHVGRHPDVGLEQLDHRYLPHRPASLQHFDGDDVAALHVAVLSPASSTSTSPSGGTGDGAPATS